VKDELPPGWAVAPLGEITEINPRHRKGLDDSMPVSFAPMAALSESKPEFKFFEERPLGKVRKGFTHFAEGDVLFAKITPCMENGKGAVATGLRNGLGCGTTELHVLRPLSGIDRYYLYRFLAQPSVRRQAKENFTGTAGQARVPTSFIEQLEIPLPPLPEQCRIVAKLEKLLAKVDACQQRLAKIPILLKRFRKSVLAAACFGQLTQKWREDNRVGNDWQQVALSDVCRSITDGDHQAPPKVTRGVPFITISAMNDGMILLDKATRFVPLAYFNDLKPNRRAERGDVLLSVTGSIGIPALVTCNEPFVFQRHIAILKPNTSRISGQFLAHLLRTETVQRQALSVATGTAQLTIPLSGLRSFKIDLPPIEEQIEIVRKIDDLFRLADQIEARCGRAKAYANSLTQSILAKAFRGELVPAERETHEPSLIGNNS